MEINWFIFAIVGLFLIILIAYIIIQNRKDEKDLTHFLNNDYKKQQESELNDED